MKTASIIAAAVAALSGTKAEATEIKIPNNSQDDNKFELKEKKPLMKRLVLKLNLFAPESSFSAMHTSHSSHSSHASSSISSGHSSHSSHASHVSSSVSPSYTPSYPSTPTYTPTTPSRTSGNSNTQTTDQNTSITEETTLEQHTLGTRVLKLGMEGTDVKELQELLVNKGYDVKISGFFGDETDRKVKSFQKTNNMSPDGKVGPTTLKALQK